MAWRVVRILRISDRAGLFEEFEEAEKVADELRAANPVMRFAIAHESNPPDEPVCPACGAVAGIQWVTEHTHDCAWLNDPESEPY